MQLILYTVSVVTLFMSVVAGGKLVVVILA